VRFISGDIWQLSDVFKHPRKNGIDDSANGGQMATWWKDALVGRLVSET